MANKPSKTDTLYGRPPRMPDQELSEAGSTTITEDNPPINKKNRKGKTKVSVEADPEK